MITWAAVVLVAPELGTVPVERQDALLADVAAQLDADALGARYDLASKYLAAHLATVSLRGGNGPAGPVVSQSAGDLSRTFAQPQGGTGTSLDSTNYGREFQRLVSLSLGGLGVVS